MSIKPPLIPFIFMAHSGDIIISLLIQKSGLKTGQRLEYNMSIAIALILMSGFT